MPVPINILQETLPNGLSFEMILVEGGSFMMGSEDSEARDSEKPVHEVILDGYYIGKFPVTQALWKAVMGDDNNPSYFKGSERPVEMVSWEDTQLFLQALQKLTSKIYRLPTEAEWEYAARGGNQSEGYRYAGSNKLKEVAWYEDNSHEETNVVGLKYPNELGIHDMSGNVWEWVEDQWHSNYQGAPTDGSAWVDRGDNTSRVLRGGSWLDTPRFCRCSSRGYIDPRVRNRHFGIRLCLSLQSGG
ncbi:MAG: formylglycine-generating enzyme family protein [Lewinellaceae bacterium]|nr:formylglycine-generating enzyme family protein [Lewinellaceae bacterium]